MPESDEAEHFQTRQKWNVRYRQTESTPKPARVLLENRHLLPPTGRALDLACGLRGNALLLAEHGLDTWAWDISDMALARVQEAARQRGVSLRVAQRYVQATPPPPRGSEPPFQAPSSI